MSQLPTAPRIFFQLPKPRAPYLGTSNLQQHTWSSHKLDSQVRESSALLENGRDMWPPQNMWYPVATVLMIWNLS